MKTVEMEESAYEDLRTAFQHNQYDTECYLDTEDGSVIWFSADTPPVDGEPDGDDPQWVHEAYEKRMKIWQDDNGRFLEVPPGDLTDACEDMQAFLDEHASEHLARKFASSGRNRGVFENFRRAVERHPEDKRAWRKFRRERCCQRIREWLELQGYTLETE